MKKIICFVLSLFFTVSALKATLQSYVTQRNKI